MAINFPNSPGIGSVFTDSTSGFSYEWDGTVWKSYSPSSSNQIKIIDDISGSFNGIGQTFALTSSSIALSPNNSASLLINLGGVIQDPSDDYSVSGSNIVFSTAPTSGLTFSGIQYGPAIPVTVVTIPDGTATDGDFTVSGTLNVGTAATVNSTGANVTGVVTATSFSGDGSALTGVISGVEVLQGGTSSGTGITALNFSGATIESDSATGVSTITIAAGGISTTSSSPSANTVVTLDLSSAQHHELTLTAGITTITCSGGSFGDSHSVVLIQPSSGIATVGFSTFFLFPSGSVPVMSEGSGKFDLISFVVKRVGAGGTQLLASAGLDYQ